MSQTIEARIQLLVDEVRNIAQVRELRQEFLQLDENLERAQESGQRSIRQINNEMQELDQTVSRVNRNILQTFDQTFERQRQQIQRAVSSFGDLGTDFRTLTGAATEFGLLTPEAERSANRFAEFADSIEASARLASNSFAIVAKSIAALGVAAVPVAAGVAAVGAGMFLLNESLNEAKNSNLAFIESLDEISVQGLDRLTLSTTATVDALDDLRAQNEQYLETLQGQQEQIQQRIRQAREDQFLGFGDVGLDDLETALDSVESSISDVSANLRILNDEAINAAAGARDFVSALREEYEVKLEVAQATRDATEAQVDAYIAQLEIEQEVLSNQRAEVAQQLSSVSPVRGFLEELNTLVAEFGGAALSLEDIDFLAAATNAEELQARFNEIAPTFLDDSRAFLTEAYEELNNDLQEAISALQRGDFGASVGDLANLEARLTTLQDFLPTFGSDVADSFERVFEESTVAIDPYLEELAAIDEQIANTSERIDLWNTTVREAAIANDEAAAATERYTDNLSQARQAIESQRQAEEQLSEIRTEQAQEAGRALAEAVQQSQLSQLDAQIEALQAQDEIEQQAQALADIREQGVAREVEIQQNYNNQIAQLAQQAVEGRREAVIENARQIEALEIDLARRRVDIQRDLSRDLQAAARENDTLAAFNAQVNAAFAESDLETEAARRLEDQERALEQELEDLEDYNDDRRQELRQQYRDELQAQREQNQARLQEQRQSFNQELSQTQQEIQALQNRRVQLEQGYQEQLTSIQEQYQRQRTQQTINLLQQEIKAAQRIISGFGDNSTQNAASAIIDAGFGFATGGIELFDRPTYNVFGENGRELGIGLPLRPSEGIDVALSRLGRGLGGGGVFAPIEINVANADSAGMQRIEQALANHRQQISAIVTGLTTPVGS